MEEGMFNPAEFNKLEYKVTDHSIIEAMLYQIPGLGMDKAKKIAEKYDHSFIKMLEKMNVKDLQEIDGIGEVIADKVIKLFAK